MYGGAAGGGKSHLMRVAAIEWCNLIPGLQVYIFRRIFDDLIKNHMEGRRGFRAMLAGLEQAGIVKIVEDEIRFANGSRIFLCHCEHEKHVYKYQGAEMDVLMIDEITHFTAFMYNFLRGRLRQVGLELSEHLRVSKFFPRVLVSGNPGNIGHLWVKKAWIAGKIPNRIYHMQPEDGGMKRVYIPARLDDNPSLMEADPGYELRLEGLGSKALVEGLRWGNWDVVEGAFFDCWDARRHVLKPFAIPADWPVIRSMDWGSGGQASPASVGWWAVVQDNYKLEAQDIILPRGALVRIREFYGTVPGLGGLKHTAKQVAEHIITMERGDPFKVEKAVLDPSAFQVISGPSVGEQMNTELQKARRTGFVAADNRRVSNRGYRDRSGPVSGWDQLRLRMIGDKLLGPMIYCFDTCVDSIRTIPVLQHDPLKAEDLDTKSEDHCADEWRYACMARPWVKMTFEVEQPKDGYAPPSDLIPQSGFKTM